MFCTRFKQPMPEDILGGRKYAENLMMSTRPIKQKLRHSSVRHGQAYALRTATVRVMRRGVAELTSFQFCYAVGTSVIMTTG